MSKTGRNQKARVGEEDERSRKSVKTNDSVEDDDSVRRQALGLWLLQATSGLRPKYSHK